MLGALIFVLEQKKIKQYIWGSNSCTIDQMEHPQCEKDNAKNCHTFVV